MKRSWLIFNERRRVWWRENEAGYTEAQSEAGRYTDAEALAIVERMNDHPSAFTSGDGVRIVPANGHWG